MGRKRTLIKGISIRMIAVNAYPGVKNALKTFAIALRGA